MVILREAIRLDQVARPTDWDCAWHGLCCLSGLCCKHELR